MVHISITLRGNVVLAFASGLFVDCNLVSVKYGTFFNGSSRHNRLYWSIASTKKAAAYRATPTAQTPRANNFLQPLTDTTLIVHACTTADFASAAEHKAHH